MDNKTHALIDAGFYHKKERKIAIKAVNIPTAKSDAAEPL